MLDCNRLVRIAERIEKALGIDAGLAEDVQKRTDEEKKNADVVTPCLEAADEKKEEESPKVETNDEPPKEDSKIAMMKRILAMIKSIKESRLSEDKKKELLSKIRSVAKFK